MKHLCADFMARFTRSDHWTRKLNSLHAFNFIFVNNVISSVVLVSQLLFLCWYHRMRLYPEKKLITSHAWKTKSTDKYNNAIIRNKQNAFRPMTLASGLKICEFASEINNCGLDLRALVNLVRYDKLASYKFYACYYFYDVYFHFIVIIFLSTPSKCSQGTISCFCVS